jgi:hypothetical protein
MSRPAILVLALAAVSLPATSAIAPPAVPRSLQAAPDVEAAFMLSGSGVHVFECKVNGLVADAYGWSFTAPDATLYEGGSRSVGIHNVPNLWESSTDRSSVSGIINATQGAGANNLPWARLRALPLSVDGMFAGVTSIQRVNTSGGVAPAGGCGADNVGAEARIGFRADYYFYKRRGSG